MTEQELKQLREAKEKWEKEVRQPYVKECPERRKEFKNDIEQVIEPLYTPLDLEERGFSYLKDLGFPGQYPWVRGFTPNGNRSSRGDKFCYADCITGIYSGLGIAEEWNQRIKNLVKWGIEEVRIAIDLPTQVGYDSDHLMARGEVGRTGVAIDSLEDMERLYEDVAIDKIPMGIGFMGNSWGPLALALNVVLGEKKGLKPSDYRVELQNDPMKEFFARGTYIYPMEASVKLAADVYEWCANNAPHWIAGYMCCSHINGAGAGSLKASAYAMMNGFLYLDELVKRGYSVDQIMPVMGFFFDEREDFFTMISIYRASRKLWAKFMKERYGAEEGVGTSIMMTAYPHGGETLQEPINNIIRIALSALAFYLGGTNVLHPAGYDEAMATPGDQAAKLQIRTSQIVNNELGFNRTIDPLAGSYYVESLTIDIANAMEAEIKKVEEEFGGPYGAINAGYYQGWQTKNSFRRQEVVESGDRLSVGVNVYPTDEGLPKGALRMDPKLEERQVERLKKLKERRDNQKVKAALKEVKRAAEAGENTVESVLQAVRAYATVGEICDVWREIYGEYVSTNIL